MLFGSDCLVLFLRTSAHLTAIPGLAISKIQDADILTSGTVEVTFETGEQEEKK